MLPALFATASAAPTALTLRSRRSHAHCVATRRPRDGLLPDRRRRACAAARPAARPRHHRVRLGASAHSGGDPRRVATPPRRDTKRRAPAAARRAARPRAPHRDAPARGQSARQPSPRAPHRTSRLRATFRPRRAGADRDHQLLVRCMRACRRVRLPLAARDHRRLLRPRTRRLGRTRRPGWHGVCVEHFLLSRALVANLQTSGLSVTTGTVNHAAILAPLLPLGLDAIPSDSPHELRPAISRKLQTAPVAA